VSGPTPCSRSRPGVRAVTSGTISSSSRSSWAPGELGAAAELAQRQQGVVADHAACAGPQRGQLGDQLGRHLAGEPGADVVGAGDDQGARLIDGLGPLRAGGALGDH